MTPIEAAAAAFDDTYTVGYGGEILNLPDAMKLAILAFLRAAMEDDALRQVVGGGSFARGRQSIQALIDHVEKA